MLCQKCLLEMKQKEKWKKRYPLVFRCDQCGAYTILYESGRLEWHDENGQIFTPKVNT